VTDNGRRWLRRGAASLSVRRPSPQVADHRAIPFDFRCWRAVIFGVGVVQRSFVACAPTLQAFDEASDQSHGRSGHPRPQSLADYVCTSQPRTSQLWWLIRITPANPEPCANQRSRLRFDGRLQACRVVQRGRRSSRDTACITLRRSDGQLPAVRLSSAFS